MTRKFETFAYEKQKDLVFYQDNTVGEIVRNYLQACTRLTIVKA